MMKIRYTLFAALVGLTCMAGTVLAVEDRMPPIPAEKLTDAQKRSIELLSEGTPAGGAPRNVSAGPWVPLMRSPELLNRLQRMGAYLRYESALEPRLSEFVILLTARQWSNQYEWLAHQKLAVKAGVAPAVTQAISEGRRPVGMNSEEEAVYDFIDELERNKSVSDPTYARIKEKFGERGVIDLIAIHGYYSMLAAVLNVAQSPLPGNAPQQIPALPR
ncbi:carboxymuconolactone decarboxylase family protein [Cupriavidus pauculus]|uniref:carboxymuconolactone decarboxylase family protein n=1 Tax=Cupriavidus pauculus TaxID=82633 RepID=UPI001EE38F05|nr:carboxymuconolactone decarboxylase family protein [Cupriavidus pauculus]GJG96774.1 carboxymuconolactone decarboxylase family protein [Cupriavidus pauculus]